MNLKPRLFGGGKLTETERGWVLTIPAGSRTQYRLAQLDDHLRIPRKQYPWFPGAHLQVQARASAASLPGTWGFGLWNDPYGFSFGPGNGFLRLPALPNAAWFFSSSAASYLSFRNDLPGNGFLGQVFSSPRFHPLLVPALLTFPLSRTATRRLLSRVIGEQAVRLDAQTQADSAAPGAIDVREWHTYALEWTASTTSFFVDGDNVLQTVLSPHPPLGLVIWIDNQRAAFDPRGKIAFGLEPNPEPAWLEIRDIYAK